MINDQDSSSDESDTCKIGGWPSPRHASPRPGSKFPTASQQREVFKLTREVPSVSIESVDGDVDVRNNSITSLGRQGRPTPSRSPSPIGFLDRDSSGSTSSIKHDLITESQETDFVIVSRSAGRRVSDALSQWRPLNEPRSGDELSGYEDNVGPEYPIVKSVNFERSQLYLLLARCVSYPFTAKYQLENSPPKLKLTEDKLKQISRTLNSTLAGERLRYQDSALTQAEQKVCRDRRFLDCIQWYVDVVLQREDVLAVCKNGSYSAKEIVAIFKVRATKHLTYSSPNRILDSEELQLWTNTFRKLVERVSRAFSGSHSPLHLGATPPATSTLGVSGNAPNPDRLYKLFQKILKIKSNEHQILYKECQLGNSEEQEAVVRRELQNRKKILEDRTAKVGDWKFGSHRVEEIFRDEQLKMLKVLNSNLDQLSLSGSAINPAQQRKKRGTVVTENGNITVAKQDLQFKLKVTVTIRDLTGVPTNETRPLFCVFEVEGSGEQLKTQEVQQRNGVVSFVEAGDFWTHSPTPQIKVSLMVVAKGIISIKTIAKKVHVATPSSADVYTSLDMYKNDKDSEPFGRLKLSTVVERPAIIKKCGYLTAVGDYIFKDLKKRFFALIQLSQYKFILSTYSPGASHPKVTILLDQMFSVEFPSTDDDRLDDPEATVMFVLISEESEMGRIKFGCRDDSERESWMKWMVRATGQNFEPQKSSLDFACSNDLGRYGLQEVVDSVKDITKIEPHKMFVQLFRAILDYRLSEDVFSRGLFSPAQLYVLDEFCARYGVRDPFRHLTCLRDWLVKEEEGQGIWPVMMLSSFRFCQMHVGGLSPPEKSVIVTADERKSFIQICQQLEEMLAKKIQKFRTSFPFGFPKDDLKVTFSRPPEKSVIVTADERKSFIQICQQLEEMLAKKIQKFRTSFPFGFPKDDLKVTLKLFDLVVTNNYSSGQGGGASPIRLLTNVMEKAALLNYKTIFSSLQVDNEAVPLTMTQLSELAQLCIEFMYELHDYYWEDFTQYSQVFSSHLDSFWQFFLIDAREAMLLDDSMISKLQLFHVVNRYFCSQPTLKLGRFHRTFLEDFTIIVNDYIDTLEVQLKDDLSNSFTLETWLPVSECCQAVSGALNALQSFKSFIDELAWPEQGFASQLEQKVGGICAQRLQEAASVIEERVRVNIQSSTLNLRYHLPHKLVTMINTLVYLNAQTVQLCSHHLLQSGSSSSLEETPPTNIDEYLSVLLHQAVSVVINAMCEPMEGILVKLSKLDPKDGFMASLKMMLPNNIPLDGFNQFISTNLEVITMHMASSIFSNFAVNWYECQLQLMKQWLEERPNFSLHETQQQSVVTLTESLHNTFSVCKLPTEQLESDTYTAIQDRIRIENSHVDLLNIGRH